MMLQSLISLSDDEIELVTATVDHWCRANHCAIDRAEGRRALTAAINLIQNKHREERLLEELTARLHPPRSRAIMKMDAYDKNPGLLSSRSDDEIYLSNSQFLMYFAIHAS